MAKALTDIRSLARSHTATCIKVLHGIMTQPDAPPSARVAAVAQLLDRGWGKAPQLSTNSSEEFKRALEMSDDELAAIAAGRPAAVEHLN